jgi:hypothetical protein
MTLIHAMIKRILPFQFHAITIFFTMNSAGQAMCCLLYLGAWARQLGTQLILCCTGSSHFRHVVPKRRVKDWQLHHEWSTAAAQDTRGALIGIVDLLEDIQLMQDVMEDHPWRFSASGLCLGSSFGRFGHQKSANFPWPVWLPWIGWNWNGFQNPGPFGYSGNWIGDSRSVFDGRIHNLLEILNQKWVKPSELTSDVTPHSLQHAATSVGQGRSHWHAPIRGVLHHGGHLSAALGAGDGLH